MDFKEYQKKALRTALYPDKYKVFYPVMGMGGEVGEFMNKIGKSMRGDREIKSLDIDEIAKELGDVLWFLSQTCTDLGLDLDTIAIQNIEKLSSRAARGKIMGDGDNR
jgi:NTP pyrophosphatase (non-canonical NTP hydrolase)